MSNAIEAMERERQCKRELRRNLRSYWPRAKRCRHGSRLEVPAEQRSDEVADAKDVECAGERGTCEAVCDGCVPGDLGAVDGEMGGSGTMSALVDENLVGVCGGHLLGCDGSNLV